MAEQQRTGVTWAGGFDAAGVAAGLKTSGAPDVAVVVNRGAEAHRAAAAVFTPNRFRAAPVQWSQSVMERVWGGGAAPVAVVLNSGGANACTGAGGLQDAAATAARAAGRLGCQAQDVLVCSTGLIGARLDMPKLTAGLDAAMAQASPEGGAAAAAAIITTDTHPKTVERAIDQDGGAGYRIGGMAKGAGMLAPELATMLVVVTTDAVVEPAALQAALDEAAARSFNRIDSDGCMSTNDTLIALASGASGVTPDPAGFQQALTEACQALARQLIGDAEGADHDIAVHVRGAASEPAALQVARAIARSNLLKAAIYGKDPNWGRVLAAAGTVPPEVAPFDPAQVDVTINGVTVCRGGGVGEDRALVDLGPREVRIEMDLKAGPAQATIWTNDLTHEYVHINADYES